MDPEREVLDHEASRCDAMVAADLGALDRLLSDGLSWTHASAHLDDKAGFLAKVGNGSLRYLEITRSDERVRLHDAAAVVTGVADIRAAINGQERQLRNRYTNVWARSGSGWQMIAWQSTGAP